MRKPLFHYTTSDAFQKIIESRQLRASSILFLNDAAEFRLAADLTAGILHDALHTATAAERRYLEVFAKALPTFRPTTSVFVASLSAVRDDLSQWRAYGHHGAGVCIAFDTRTLSAQLRKAGHRLIRCIYRPPTQAARIRAFALAQIQAATASGHDPVRALIDFLEAFVDFAPQLKDSHFAAEREWRIVLAPPDRIGTVQFVCSGSILRPYRDFPIPLESIYDVIVGPTSSSALTRQSLEAFLQYRGLPRSVTPSNVPYRRVGA